MEYSLDLQCPWGRETVTWRDGVIIEDARAAVDIIGELSVLAMNQVEICGMGMIAKPTQDDPQAMIIVAYQLFGKPLAWRGDVPFTQDVTAGKFYG